MSHVNTFCDLLLKGPPNILTFSLLTMRGRNNSPQPIPAAREFEFQRIWDCDQKVCCKRHIYTQLYLYVHESMMFSTFMWPFCVWWGGCLSGVSVLNLLCAMDQ